MRVNVWLVYKANEPRIYTRTEEPSSDQKAAYKSEGFQLFRASVYLPVDEETHEVLGSAFTEEEYTEVDGQRTRQGN